MARATKATPFPPGVARDDSDDELGIDDYPWEWVYDTSDDAHFLTKESEDVTEPGRKRRREGAARQSIVGARMGTFSCSIGDCVLLKAEGSNEAWVGIIHEFVEDDEDGDKAANFLWFSTEKEIRKSDRKRTDFLWVC